MHMLVDLHGQPGWVAALTPLSVDGMIVAASTTLLADSRSGGRGSVLPWALLVVGSVASLAANVAVAEPTVTGRVIAAWPSFALIGSYELLMCQVPNGAGMRSTAAKPAHQAVAQPGESPVPPSAHPRPKVPTRPSLRSAGGLGLRQQAWAWALGQRAEHGSLPSGRAIADRYGRHERWGRLVKRAGLAGEFNDQDQQDQHPMLECIGSARSARHRRCRRGAVRVRGTPQPRSRR